MMRFVSFAAMIGLAVLLIAPALCQGADANSAPEGKQNPEVAQPRLKTTAEKRAWLKQQAARGVKDWRQIQQLHSRLDRLTAKQIDALTTTVLAQQLPQDQQQQLLEQTQQELLRAQMLRQMLENELWWRRGGGVGYLPVVTWLPEGAALGASAVVSPDRRHVRVSAAPFFSSVGPVYTYNLNTGDTRLWPPQAGYPVYPYLRQWPYTGYTSTPQFGQMPSWHQPPPAPSARVQTWHDGIRTRVGPKPGQR
jgi:hypothetical protein